MSAVESLPDWMNVSRETHEKLMQFCRLVDRWNPTINLVAKSTIPHLWHRHVLDSAQLFEFLPENATHWLDLGSGAGFPGLVVAILASEGATELRVTLVESDRRKAVFLSEVIRNLSLTTRVICQRIEGLPRQNADVLSARALAPLPVLCGFADAHLNGAGTAVFPKGSNSAAEIVSAQEKWKFSLSQRVSRTDPDASVLVLKDIRNA